MGEPERKARSAKLDSDWAGLPVGAAGKGSGLATGVATARNGRTSPARTRVEGCMVGRWETACVGWSEQVFWL
jgi:hypothetical protein